MTRISAAIAPSFYQLFWDVYRHRHNNYWLKGGRGSTKSSFISVMIIFGMMTDAQSNAVVLRKYASTLRETAFDQYLWAIDILGVYDLWHASVSPMQLTYLPTGQQIRFKGVDTPKKIKSQKFRHGYTKFIHYEECDDFNGLREIRSVNQSLNRGGDDVVVFYSYNPPASQNSWVNQAAVQAATRNDTLVHSSDYLTVPPRWLGKGFIADAKQLKKDNLAAYRHEYLGEITGTGAEVFTNLSLREISAVERANFDRIYHGLDFGFAHDPLAFITMYFDATRRRLFIYRELYAVGLGNTAAIEKIKVLNPDNDLIIADSAEPRTVYEFHDAGLNVIGARKPKGSVEYTTKWLQDLRQIIIDPITCPNTAREFSGYELDRDKNDNLISKFPDRDNHTLDAVRYGMQPAMRRGGQ